MKFNDLQKGVSLLITFFIIGIFIAVVLGISVILVSEIKIIKEMGYSVVAFYAADSGVEKTLYYDRKVLTGGGSRGLCDICNTCSDCYDCQISGNDCSIQTCNDCEISYYSEFNGKEHRVKATIVPAGEVSDTILKSFGTFQGTTRGIELVFSGVATQTSLVAYYKMDDNTSNKTVVDNQGSYNGTAQQNTSVLHIAGKINGALTFNGSSDAVLLPDIDNTISNQLTVSAWIYPLNAEGDYQGITGNQTNQGLMTFIKAGQFVFDIKTSSGRVILGKGTIVNNQWQMVTGTYDGTTMIWYVNKINVGTAPQTGNILQFASGRIGYSGSGAEYFKGSIDNVMIFNKALNQEEIDVLYSTGE